MRSLLLLSLFAAVALADGPKDNVPAAVRPIPPTDKAVPLPEADKVSLTKELAELRTAIDAAAPTGSPLTFTWMVLVVLRASRARAASPGCSGLAAVEGSLQAAASSEVATSAAHRRAERPTKNEGVMIRVDGVRDQRRHQHATDISHAP